MLVMAENATFHAYSAAICEVATQRPPHREFSCCCTPEDFRELGPGNEIIAGIISA
jgi:hypothetical protein